MDDVVLVYTTWPDAETATAAGRAAVEARLAACANILGAVTSIYRWKGAVETAPEIAMILKTTAACAEPLKALLVARHTYDVPSVAAVPVSAVGSNPAFLDWIREEARPGPPTRSG
jgi:periplasmic divalent cation tolerance protein